MLKTLLPFEKTPVLEILDLSISISRTDQTLVVDFLIEGDLAQFYLPEPSSPPRRLHELWKTTCWEVFISPDSSLGYWEVNQSPQGDWNVYSFNNYRVGQTEEVRVPAPQHQVVHFSSRKRQDRLVIDLNGLLEKRSALPRLDIGITAVLQDKKGEISYWALRHAQKQPDFHDRGSFLISL